MPGTKKLMFALVLSGLAMCLTSPYSAWAQTDNKLLERLAKEQDRLQRQKDPVDRTKTQIKVSEMLLTLITDAARTGDSESIEERLREYMHAIQDAHETMMNSGRDAQKKPGGFKDLEISLRRQLRQLEDIGGTLTFHQREPIDHARAHASKIRDELLKALFGGQNA